MSSYNVRGLDCRLGGRTVLAGLHLDIAPGEVLALVGPNGAGKSTLLGVLAGDLPPAAGTVALAGRPLPEWPHRDLARERAVLLQANQVSFPFTVAEVIEMGRSPWQGRPESDEDDEAVAEALRLTDTEALTGRRFTELSGGERARVSLARVLAQRTPVVLLDEPTAALDLRHQEDVMAIARNLAAAGRTVVTVLHDLSLAAAWADRIAVLSRGELVAAGPPAEVLTAELIGEVYGLAVHILTDTPDGRPVVVPKRTFF